MVQLGWVVSVDVVSGSVQWVAGPLEQGPLGLTLTEPVLLAASTPAPGDTGWLYGLHKVTGAALYSLPCAGGQCTVQVVDTHIGLLTAALLQQPPSLDELAAFEFATGKLLWRGVQDSKLLGYVVGDCTGLADATMHTYFACSCKAAEAAAAGLVLTDDVRSHPPAEGGPALAVQHAKGMAGMAADLLDAAAAPVGDGVLGAALDSQGYDRHRHNGHGHDEHGRKPRPRPDPRPGPGLCAFAISTNSGKLGFEVVLSSTDAVAPGAAAYGLKPFVMADTVVFPGRKAIYAMPRLSAPHPQQQMHNAQPGDASSGSGRDGRVGNVLAAGASEAATNARRLYQQATGGGAASTDASSSSSVRPVFSYSLPTGVVMQPWDWLDLKAGTLLLRASPHFEEGSSNLGSAASGRDSSGSSSMGQQLHAGTGMPGRPGTDSSSGDGVGGGGGRRRAMETKSKPHWVVDSPHTWLVALDPQNGTRRWSLALDVWLGPLSPHALPHEWGRGGVLLVDGCRPPAADEPDGGTGEGSSGSMCCLHAVSLASGELLWRNCFDMDRTCASGLGRRTATLIVYILLAAQVVVLLLGCVLGVWWHRRMRRRAAASIMQDPDSEDEPLLVQVLPQGYSIPTSGRVVS